MSVFHVRGDGSLFGNDSEETNRRIEEEHRKRIKEEARAVNEQNRQNNALRKQKAKEASEKRAKAVAAHEATKNYNTVSSTIADARTKLMHANTAAGINTAHHVNFNRTASANQPHAVVQSVHKLLAGNSITKGAVCTPDVMQFEKELVRDLKNNTSHSLGGTGVVFDHLIDHDATDFLNTHAKQHTKGECEKSIRAIATAVKENGKARKEFNALPSGNMRDENTALDPADKAFRRCTWTSSTDVCALKLKGLP